MRDRERSNIRGQLMKGAAQEHEVQDLISSGVLRMRWSPQIMHCAVPAQPASEDRIRGMLFGLAIGDALGNTTESQLPGERRERYGEIRDYLPNRPAGGQCVGLPSDDTQLAFWTLEHLLDLGKIEPFRLAQLFASRQIYGIGRTTWKFIEAIHADKSWIEASQASASNGAFTRVPPIILPHIWSSGTKIWRDIVLATAVTHNDPAAIGASIAFSAMLVELLTWNGCPDSSWWVDTFVKIAREIEGDNRLAPRGGPLFGKWSGPLWQFVEQFVPQQAQSTCLEASMLWYSGAYLLETVPTALHILMQHAADPEEAIVRAVNDTRDNDSIAAVVGAAVGALHGYERLPERWRIGLLGRTQQSDDGRVFELVERSLVQFRSYRSGTG